MSGKFIFSLSNKMIGKGRKILKSLLSLFFVSFFIFTSCIIDCDEPDTSFQSIENSTSSSSSISSSSELPVSNEAIPQKAILKIGFADDNSARTVLPKVQLSNYVLKGSLAGGASVVLATADTKEEMKTKEIELDPGVWSFTLSADMTGTSVLSSVKSYSDTQNVTLTGNPVTVNFDLKPRDSNGTEITKGAVSISLTLSSDVISANKARASLKLGGVEKAAKEDDVSAGGTFTFTAENLDKDTYDLEIEFYSKDVDSGTIIPQNTWQALVRIEPGLLSSAEVTGFNLNEVYNITYENVGDAVPASGIAIKSFSRKSASFITLPTYTKSDSSFAGWYDNAAFEGSSITEFNPANASSDVTFYAKWVSTTIYVKQGATGSGDSLDNAVGNFSAAFDVMKEIKTLSETANRFFIRVCGQVDGNQSLPTGLTSDIATEIIIEGNTGLDAAGVPENSLYGKKTGTVLTVSTTVPVIIQNLKIYGGSGSKGGGIYMGSGTNVTLESGALIGDSTEEAAASNAYGNKAEVAGGGIYVDAGTLILKKGSKVCRNYAGSYDSDKNSGGGGIASNFGKITIEEGAYVSWNKTGGRGGGIWLLGGNSASILTMNGGEISHNETEYWGGGLLVGSVNGYQGESCPVKFYFKGGEICNNKSTSEDYGWGVGGGGLIVDHSYMEMSGSAKIHDNESKNAGGGLRIGSNSVFLMSGGEIYDNTCSGATSGGGLDIEVNSKVVISGSAKIPYGFKGDKGYRKNDIWLRYGDGETPSYITVGGALSSTFEMGIELNCQRGLCIARADGTNVTDLTPYKDYFNLINEDWLLNLSGDNKMLVLDSPIYVAGNNYKVCTKPGSYSAETTGKKSAPFDTIYHACSLLSDSNCHYTILVDGELNGELNGAQTLPSSGIAAASITLKGANGNTSDIINANASESSPASALTISLPATIPVYIENLTITGGYAENGGGINIGENAVVFLGNDLIITGNKAFDFGGGVYAPNGLNVEGNLVITENTDSSGNPSNLYLPAGKCVNVNGALTKGSERAKIGISTADEPSLTSRIAFTLNYGSYNSDTAPGTYFTGDKWNVAWGSGTAAGEAVLAVSGGNITIEPIYEDITISADKTSFEKDAASKIITFSAKGKDSEGYEQAISIRSDDGQVEITSFTVTCHGETVPKSYYEKDENEGTLTLGNSLPLGNYVVSITASYKDRTYSASFSVEIFDAFNAEKLTPENYDSIQTIAVISSEGFVKLAELASSGKDFSDKTITLSKNITITDSSFTGIKTFKGTFNGMGNSITATMSNVTGSYVGLFNNVSGTVENLVFKGSITVTDSSNSSTAMIAKLATNGVVRNCRNEASITSIGSSVAGLVGTAENGTVIELCSNTAAIHGTKINSNTNIGGILGYGNAFTMRNCYNTGDIDCDNTANAPSRIGGLLGQSQSSHTITACYTTGNVTCGGEAITYSTHGHLFGFLRYGTIRDCACSGNKTGSIEDEATKENIVTSVTSKAQLPTCFSSSPWKAVSGSIWPILED